MIQVTMQQWNMLTFINTYRRQQGIGPSYLDIAKACDYRSIYTVGQHLKLLEAAGVVRFGKFKSGRTLTLCAVPVGVAP